MRTLVPLQRGWHSALTWAARLGSLLSLLSFAVLVSNAHLFPQVGTDSLIYHLTIPAFWLQRGFLAPIDLPFHDSAAEHGPLLTQAIHYVLLRLRGDDSLCWLVQPVFFLLTLWWYYLSCRLVGASRAAAAALCGLLTFFPPFLTNIAEANNDHVLVCGAAWMLYGVLRCQTNAGKGLVHAIAGWSLLLASKHVGVIYAAAGLPLIVWAAKRGWRKAEWNVAGVGVAAISLVVGGIFNARNVFSYGNPLYPATVKLLGVTLFAGLYDAAPLVDHGWRVTHMWRMLVHDAGAADDFAPRAWACLPLWAGWVITAVAWLLTSGAARMRSRGAALLASKQWHTGGVRWGVAVGFPLASVLLFFWKVPFWQEHRLLFPVYYALWVSAAAAVAIFSGLLARRWPWRHLADLCLLAFLAWQLVVSSPERVRQMFLTSQLAKHPAAAIRNERYEAKYGAQGRAWNLLRDLTRDTPAGIAYAGTAIVFPLFGETLRNRVEYVPLSVSDMPTAIELRRGESLDLRLAQARRQESDAAYWLQQLNARGIQHLYLVDDPTRGGVAPEREIVAAHPERFRLLLHADNVWVYRVRPPQ